MQRAGAELSLHERLMGALERGARAQEHSRLLVETHSAVHARVTATLAELQARRERGERGVAGP